MVTSTPPLSPKKRGISFTKEGNCFTHISGAADLGRVADALCASRTIGRLSRVCERWIYTCLSFALDSEEQAQSGFRYQCSADQVEYSRKLIFQVAGGWSKFFRPWWTGRGPFWGWSG